MNSCKVAIELHVECCYAALRYLTDDIEHVIPLPTLTAFAH